MTIWVKYLSSEAIEKDAEALLSEYAHARNVTIEPPIPIEEIVEKHLKLRVDFDDLHQVLGVPKVGSQPDILGALWVDKREIIIDESLDPEVHPELEGRYRFTLAHDGGGHWRLHRRYLSTDLGQASNELSKPAVICRSSQARERVELQADAYASCLLMPRALVMKAWRIQFGTDFPVIYELMKDMHVARRPRWYAPRPFGEVITEMVGEVDHFYLFNQVARVLAPIFGVSIQAMRIRLERLGLLQREVPPQLSLAVGS